MGTAEFRPMLLSGDDLNAAAKHMGRILDWADAKAKKDNRGDREPEVKVKGEIFYVEVPTTWEYDNTPDLIGICVVITSTGSISHMMTVHHEFDSMATEDMESDGWEMVNCRDDDMGPCECGKSHWDAIRLTYEWHARPVTTLNRILDEEAGIEPQPEKPRAIRSNKFPGQDGWFYRNEEQGIVIVGPDDEHGGWRIDFVPWWGKGTRKWTEIFEQKRCEDFGHATKQEAFAWAHEHYSGAGAS